MLSSCREYHEGNDNPDTIELCNWGITGDVYRFCPLVNYVQSTYILTLTPFLKGPDFWTKFDPIHDFFKRRATYHLQA